MIDTQESATVENAMKTIRPMIQYIKF